MSDVTGGSFEPFTSRAPYVSLDEDGRLYWIGKDGVSVVDAALVPDFLAGSMRRLMLRGGKVGRRERS